MSLQVDSPGWPPATKPDRSDTGASATTAPLATTVELPTNEPAVAKPATNEAATNEPAVVASPSGGTFAALRIPNFRLFLSGQIVSLCGTWMQTIALGWLVLSLGASGTALVW
ncbi:hypothetical protein [Candidatus Frankia alpina]|uniref:hypothetical protein n=1 Tax=Candidatus Frankia alpina TaxID=2699483 RepID=UPI003AF46265